MMLDKKYKYILTVLGLLLPFIVMAEPSGRGVDFIEPTSPDDALGLLILGTYLLPYVIIYGIGTNIDNIPLRVVFYVVLTALCIWGEYYCIVELEANNLFRRLYGGCL